MAERPTSFSAAEQGLGYIHQVRFALLKVLSLPENNSFALEKDDDVDITNEFGRKSLVSLKHKAVGEHLTDLSTDFWKSVRIWLAHYEANGRIASESRFFLITTSATSGNSFLTAFLEGAPKIQKSLREQAKEVLNRSTATLITKMRPDIEKLSDDEFEDFLSRITIFDNSLRITDVPAEIVNNHLRTIRRETRPALFERLEGWWTDLVIKMLSGERTSPIFGYEVSDKLSQFAEEYRSDNLPITFRNKQPEGEIDTAGDPRIFVEQLRFIGVSAARIQSAIVDYYRAFEQRSSWARETLLISGEIEEYEDRLVDEWVRYREVVFEALGDKPTSDSMAHAGRELYKWAEFETENIRIRERVTEPYVVRGGFHILANAHPIPRVYWHPKFLDRLEEILGRPK